jgi:hypothetical protein
MRSQLIRNLAGASAVAFLLCIAQVPVHAQNFTLSDGSYVAETYDEGEVGQLIVVQVDVECSGGCDVWDSMGIPIDYSLPGGFVSPYTDCDCNEDGGYDEYGFWEFGDGGAFEFDSSTWQDDVSWTFYAPNTSTALQCNGGCCDDPEDGGVDGYPYVDYYDDIEDEIFVIPY